MRRVSTYSLVFVVALVALLMPSRIGAQVLTLDSCRAMALRNNATLENARLEIESAKQTKLAALTKYFPTLSLAAGYFRSQNYLIDVSSEGSGAQIDVTARFDGETMEERIANLQATLDRYNIDVNLQSEIDNFVDRFSYDISLKMIDRGLFANAVLTQPLFAGGRIVNGNRLAKVGVDVAELKLMMSEREVLLNVEQYYWQVVLLHGKLQPVEQALVLLDTLRRDAEAAQQAGLIGRSEVLKVRLKQAEMQSVKTQILNGIELATMALCQYIGQPYSETLRVEIPQEGELQSPAAPQARVNSCVVNRPEYSLLEKAVKAERLRRKMIAGEAMPQIAVGSTYGLTDITGSYRANGILFATVSIPLTAWWETAHNMKKQQMAVRMAENNRRNNTEFMTLQQRQAYNSLREAYSQIDIKRQAADDAADNLEEVKIYYEAGLTSVSDYLEAQTLFYQAHDQLTDQLIDYKIKELRYRQLSGQ